MLPSCGSLSEELQASLLLVQLRRQLGLPNGSSVPEVVAKAIERLGELERGRDLDRSFLEASRERLVETLVGSVTNVGSPAGQVRSGGGGAR